MSKRESTVKRDRQQLQDLFVSVTGETVITDRQDPETNKKVADLVETDTPPGDQRVTTDSVREGLEDAIGDTKSK